MHPANLKRANWCTEAMNTFARETTAARLFGALNREDQQDLIGDLICDLGHFCEMNGLDYEAALQSAARHYEHETAPDYQGD